MAIKTTKKSKLLGYANTKFTFGKQEISLGKAIFKSNRGSEAWGTKYFKQLKAFRKANPDVEINIPVSAKIITTKNKKTAFAILVTFNNAKGGEIQIAYGVPAKASERNTDQDFLIEKFCKSAKKCKPTKKALKQELEGIMYPVVNSRKKAVSGDFDFESFAGKAGKKKSKKAKKAKKNTAKIKSTKTLTPQQKAAITRAKNKAAKAKAAKS